MSHLPLPVRLHRLMWMLSGRLHSSITVSVSSQSRTCTQSHIHRHRVCFHPHSLHWWISSCFHTLQSKWMVTQCRLQSTPTHTLSQCSRHCTQCHLLLSLVPHHKPLTGPLTHHHKWQSEWCEMIHHRSRQELTSNLARQCR